MPRWDCPPRCTCAALKSISTFLGHDQLGVVGEKQEHGAAIDDSRVIRLAASEVHSVTPLRGSRQKNCPPFR